MTGNPAKYDRFIGDISALLDESRRTAARRVNAVLTATYWEIGRRIVEYEQAGKHRADYGEELLKRLSADLTARFGRGFSINNIQYMRQFFIEWPPNKIYQTLSGISQGAPIRQTLSGISESRKISLTPSGKSSAVKNYETLSRKFTLDELGASFPLSWSHYVMLMGRSRSPESRAFYETEALRGGWSVRQLARQMDSQFYERTALSRNKAAMLEKGAKAQPGDILTPEREIKDPYILEFLDLKDEYSESSLEEALIRRLETFLLELGNDFTFAARQKRLRIGDEWYRVDLVFYHRRLRCLVLIDLKLGKFTHADAGQMHLYLNYALEHWTLPDENPPVGLILCARKDSAVAHYALEGLPNKVLASEYRTALPDEALIAAELDSVRRALDERGNTKISRRRGQN